MQMSKVRGDKFISGKSLGYAPIAMKKQLTKIETKMINENHHWTTSELRSVRHYKHASATTAARATFTTQHTHHSVRIRVRALVG